MSDAVGTVAPPEGLWTTKELGAFLQRSRRAIFGDLSAGKIPCARLHNGAPRFIPADIRLWLEWGCPNAQEFAQRKAALTVRK